MDTASENISEFLEEVKNNPAPSTKEKQKIYKKYSNIFFDQPPKRTRWG
jgi:hypothetical protein